MVDVGLKIERALLANTEELKLKARSASRHTITARLDMVVTSQIDLLGGEVVVKGSFS